MARRHIEQINGAQMGLSAQLQAIITERACSTAPAEIASIFQKAIATTKASNEYLPRCIYEVVDAFNRLRAFPITSAAKFFIIMIVAYID